VAVLMGDSPFISADVLASAYQQHITEGNQATVISAKVDNPTGYGRILRSHDGKVTAIAEEKDATAAEQLVSEINSGALWFETDALLDFFANMTNNNAKNEYYLTDALAHIISTGGSVGAYIADSDVVLGANTRKDLAALNRVALDKILDKHMDNGVDIPFSDGVIIGPDVVVGADTRILPGTILRGKTKIGEGSEIGPNSYLDNATVGGNCRVISTYIDNSTLEDGVKIGPMSNIRPGCVIKAGAKIGDFVEVKSSVIGEKTALAHLTYIGDSDVGGSCNFGCGVVTANYDGTNKHRTVIGDNAFIGCNVNLVAPVAVGSGAYAATGTTVTGDVPDGALVIGRARQEVRENWAKKKGLYKGK
jgi:bifunctional UDP-N-acetylglucosamine pyrophosphorylase/glucosamine-1-phosphate N-acetyltransferase